MTLKADGLPSLSLSKKVLFAKRAIANCNLSNPAISAQRGISYDACRRQPLRITKFTKDQPCVQLCRESDVKMWSRSFKWCTKHWFWSRGCKDTRGQSWKSKKISAEQPGSNPCGHGWPCWQIFFSSSNFDLWYLCSLLTKINVWYLIWKIYFVFVWRTKPKAFERILRYVIFAQIRPISIGLM